MAVNNKLLFPLLMLQKANTWTKLKIIQESMSGQDGATSVCYCACVLRSCNLAAVQSFKQVNPASIPSVSSKGCVK